MRNVKNALLKMGLGSLIFLLCSVTLVAQNITVTGTVTDQTFNEPLIGVTIVVQGTSHGTVTDINGNYTLPNVPADGMLETSYVGMQPQIIPSTESHKLLWPLDRSLLDNDDALEQTPGY